MGAIPLGYNYIKSAPTFHPPSQGRKIAPSDKVGRGTYPATRFYKKIFIIKFILFNIGGMGIPPYSLLTSIFIYLISLYKNVFHPNSNHRNANNLDFRYTKPTQRKNTLIDLSNLDMVYLFFYYMLVQKLNVLL